METSSPTVTLKTLITSLCIVAYEGRDIIIVDALGAYLNASSLEDKFILIKIQGNFVDIMRDINPKLNEDVMNENNRKVMYMRILKVLYGLLKN